MPLPPNQPALQRSTLNLYGELLCRRAGWAGQFVFAAFNGAAQTGLSAASSLAGAASLIVDSDTASVHSSNRDAAFDFVVNTLDEALRTLKNEIRRGRPLAVALLADPERILEEAAQRGLGPRLILSAPRPSSTPIELGSAEQTTHLEFSPDLVPTEPLVHWLQQHGWSAGPVPWLTPGQPAQVALREKLEQGDRNGIRANWLRNLSKYQRSVRQAGQLWTWLSPEESREFTPGMGQDDRVP